jgi:hypothetical protein
MGARRVSEGLLSVQQKWKNAFMLRHFRRYQQVEKVARHQVVWSWRPDAGVKRVEDFTHDGG